MIERLSRSPEPGALSLRVDLEDDLDAMSRLVAALAAAGGRMWSLVTLCSHPELGLVELELTVEGLDADVACAALAALRCTRRVAAMHGTQAPVFERRAAVVTRRVS